MAEWQCLVVSAVGCHHVDLKQDFLTHLVEVSPSLCCHAGLITEVVRYPSVRIVNIHYLPPTSPVTSHHLGVILRPISTGDRLTET